MTQQEHPHDLEGRILGLEQRIFTHVHQDIIASLARIEANMVTKAEIAPMKGVVYGMVALIVTAVVIALIGLVVR